MDNIKMDYVDNKFGIVFKNIATNSIDNITKGVKTILGEDSKVYEVRSSIGISGDDIEYNSFEDGYFTPISEYELGKKGYFESNLEDLYDSICKNIEIKIDKVNYENYELFVLDLPENTSVEEYYEKFDEFVENLSEEDRKDIEENDFMGEMSDLSFETFRNIKSLKEKYNVKIINSLEEKEKELEVDDKRILTNKEQKETYEFQEYFLNQFEHNLENIDATIDLSSYIESKDYSDFVDKKINDYFAFFPETKNLQETFKEKALNEVKEDIKSIIEVREDMPVSYYSKEFVSQENMKDLQKNYIEKAKEIEKTLPLKKNKSKEKSKEIKSGDDLEKENNSKNEKEMDL